MPTAPHPADDAPEDPTRRQLLKAGGSLPLLALSPTLAACGALALRDAPPPATSPAAPTAETAGPPPFLPPPLTGSLPVTLTEGTNLAFALSPDGRSLALDLQGLLWTLPLEGGEARRLGGDLDDIARPAWSPDGQRIAFQSYRSGGFQLWSVRADGSDLRQHTDGEHDCREPRYSPDGRELAFASDRGGRYAIYTLALESGAIRLVADSDGEDGEPAWSPDGRHLAFSSSGRILVAQAHPPAGQAQAPHVAVAGPGASAPAWTPDGGALVYRLLEGSGRDLRASRLCRSRIDWQQPDDGSPARAGWPYRVTLSEAGEDVFPCAAAWLDAQEVLYAADGRLRRRQLAATSGGDARAASTDIPFSARLAVTPAGGYPRRYRDFDDSRPRPVKGIAFPQSSPDGSRIVFGALNQLWLLQVGTAAPRRLTHDGYGKTYPAWAPDGRRIAYACDRDGNYDLWLLDADSGAERRLTRSHVPLKQAAWAPDGQHIACAGEDGRIYLVDANSGALRPLLRQTVWSGRPSWSPDGRFLAYAAVRPYSARYREGLNAILVHELASDRAHYHLPRAGSGVDVRNAAGPCWSPDGRHLALIMERVIWRLPVAADGSPAGEAEALNGEDSDALCWTRHGQALDYLHHGRLRRLHLASSSATAGGAGQHRIEDIPLDLRWQPAWPTATTVIHAGRLWDGRADHYLRDVDVVIHGQRIAAIEPHRAERGGVRWVDASRHCVMPGLIDMHTHREMGNQLGDREPRIFLAFGITTTRGLSDNAYLFLQNRESVEAGARVGPRHFGTGEALDGRRVFFDNMHPLRDEAAVAREMERARALDYDLIKTYVRLPPALHRRATAGAHALGIPITSHYLFPAAAFGADGYEHMGGTSRFGYSRTGSQTGVLYQDVLALSAAAGLCRTPTVFGLEGLLGDTPELVLDDPRVQTLFPPAERTALEKAARGGPYRPLPAVVRQIDAIRRMLAAGVRIVSGSDFPIAAGGISLHLNLRAMVRHGISPADALRSATSVPGAELHPELGTLAAGKLADLAIVDGDPLARIEDAAAIRAVMVGGRLHTVEELVAPYAGKNDLPPAPQASPSPHDRRYASADGHWWHDPQWVAEVRRACCDLG